MINLCKGCKHEEEICYMMEFPCLDYEPKDEEEEEEGEKNE